MTDDDLDRALAALPLEEPPAGLHAQILAATVYRAPATFRAWELCVLAAVLGVVAWLTFAMLSASPEATIRLGHQLSAGLRTAGLYSIRTYLWLAIGASAAWWISSLPFMLPQRRAVYNR